jgi:hypothetical protein
MSETKNVSRRSILTAGAASGLATVAAAATSGIARAQQTEKPAPMPKAERERIPRVAAINSIYRLRSHAYHIAGRFLFGYTRNGFHHQPPFQLVRMFNHQYPPDDLSRSVCAKHGIELCETVAKTLGGDAGLDIDGVLLIIEHGDYPVNELEQILYPRFELFQEIVSYYGKCGRTAPVFCDKHLSYNFSHAQQMTETAKRLGFRLMAGSSLPVTWRIPEIEPPLGTRFREGLVVFGYDRSYEEIYFFHALETLQCMLERRAGGETGVKSVAFLEGDEVWKAGDDGRWSWRLLEAALARSPSKNYGRPRDQVLKPQAILVEYLDGTRGTALNLIEATSDFCFAATVDGRADPVSTCFYLPAPPGANFFNPLTYNIERFFSGEQPYPVERTLLTSTILDLALRARHEKLPRVRSPALNIAYPAPNDSGFFRGPFTDA